MPTGKPGASERRATLALTWQLARRDLRARRRLSAVMLLRSLVQPLALTGLFWLLLSGILRLRFEGTPGGYPSYLLAGLLPWGFLAGVVGAATTCLTNNATLVRRVAFTRATLVYAQAAEGLVQAGLVTLVLVVAQALAPGPAGAGIAVAWLVPLMLTLVAFSLGLALLTAALSVLLPSSALALPVLLQLWFYATPIVYPPTKAPAWLAPSFEWNPVAVFVLAFRRVLLEDSAPQPTALIYLACVAAAAFIAGRSVFRWADPLLPDLV
jgi:ABC-type polysaccharide/polyol phosphate export permease